MKRDRPTVGVLSGWSVITGQLPDRYSLSVLRGIQSAARARQCHLLMTWGLGRVNDPDGLYPAWPELMDSTDFVPVGPWNTDGLIVFSPLRNERRSDYLRRLKESGFPVLHIASGDGEPMVAVNNEAGIRQAVAHLVDHDHRQIAFLAGDPNDKGDSESRLRGFYSAMADFGLDIDPRLVKHGWHNISMGHTGMRQLLDSGVPFTAVIASDDISAVGAMRAIREAGLHVPRDLALIGFDDQPDAIAQIPPLTTIHIPLAEMGEQAMLLMLDHLASGLPLSSLRLSTRLVRRQSCGCTPEVVVSALDHASRRAQPEQTPPGARAENLEAHMVIDMLAVLPPKSRLREEERTGRQCTALLQAFKASLQRGQADIFHRQLTDLVHELELTAGDLETWQEILSVLRREMVHLMLPWAEARVRLLAEDLLHQARAALGESLQRRDLQHQFAHEISAEALSRLTAGLSVTLDERQALHFLQTHLADVNVRRATWAFFKPEEADSVAWSVIPGTPPGSPDLRFPSREFPPPGLYPPDEILELTLVPIVFQAEQLGYIAFEGNNVEPYAPIARQLAATIITARLYAQVLDLSLTDPLTGLNNRRYFDLFLGKELARSRRAGSPLAVVVFDIDHFKQYNDTFGHPAGDRALQAIAGCILGGRRRDDVAARIGGEEFALILPETRAEGALAVVDKIRSATAELASLHRAMTLSAGVSVFDSIDIEPQTLVQQADMALYAAKHAGRNCVRVFSPHLES